MLRICLITNRIIVIKKCIYSAVPGKALYSNSFSYDSTIHPSIHLFCRVKISLHINMTEAMWYGFSTQSGTVNFLDFELNWHAFLKFKYIPWTITTTYIFT